MNSTAFGDPLEEAPILAALDEACARGALDPRAWPQFQLGVGEAMEFFGLGLWAARSERGWGLALCRLSGGGETTWRTELFLYGSDVGPGLSDERMAPLPLEFAGDGDRSGVLEGAVMDGPAGRLELTADLLDGLDLRPGEGSEPWSGGQATLALRAYLALFPDAVWPGSEEIMTALGLGPGARLLVETRDFEHVVGSRGAPEARGARWELPPSESAAWRSLARVLARADAATFEPGEPNTSWRDHVTHHERLDAAMGHREDGAAYVGAYDDWDDAPATLRAFDGYWRCAELAFVLRLQGCAGVVTASQNVERPVDANILHITRVRADGRAFAGHLRLSVGRVYASEGRRIDDDTLEMQAGTHTFVMRRDLHWSFS